MLTDTLIDTILARLPSLTFGVLGDLFLDRYLDIDATLTEPSVETGLDAYQVVRVRSYPGAAGTVINNLAALGVGRIIPITVIGQDGGGFELRQALSKLPSVHLECILEDTDRRTPTYTKPMLCAPGQIPRELNRLDIKNRTVLAPASEDMVLAALDYWWPKLDALLVLDQVSEPDCGVVTGRVREHLRELGQRSPEKIILADSRERIGLFRNVWLKPNQRECLHAAQERDLKSACLHLAHNSGRPVFCTQGELGILVADPKTSVVSDVPGFTVRGPIDPVGAGDSTSAGIAGALASGCTLEEAAAFGNLVASITITQIGTTGTASPEQVRERWKAVSPKR